MTHINLSQLLAKKMNLGVGGKQPCMKNRFDSATQQPQSMVFPENHPKVLLRGKPKDLKQILIERALWGNWEPDGQAFLLECPQVRTVRYVTHWLREIVGLEQS